MLLLNNTALERRRTFGIVIVLLYLFSQGIFSKDSNQDAGSELSLPNTKTDAKLFVLDASGSMNEYLGIYQKIHLAKKHVKHFVDSLPESAEVGLIAYGNRLPGCKSSKLYQPMESGNKAQFRNKLYGLTPSGATPLAESIRVAGEYISRRKQSTELILITDGIESCYGDPEKELRILQQKGINFHLNVLGLGLKPEERNVMRSLARLGQGAYYNVEGDADFYSAMEDLLKKGTVSITKQRIEPKQNSDTGKIRILSQSRMEIENGKNRYTISFDFHNSDSSSHCVVLNLKTQESPSSKVNRSNENRVSNPESIIKIENRCFQSEKGTGQFEFDATRQEIISAELELWDMSGVPRAVGRSENIDISH
ncbi:von Willebrand factor type A domain protein [Leptospira inadai serovar Lyme str. 10]|uniref:von Willebrand factor type A domain protein n=2 Tax=Leptospira inadai serovar Lyme TaxID=293084 RepID=V6H8U8_9LEPT|nr:VWA domain-containing protein [Leptospira inadai]EQA35257.1 von Willebrand factor type A domain protein [Leptospira inadai serovar Lyme str. 10]PNV76014.1 VWA domain-containing protein [Leptospira inadai serovar Lyme]